MPNIENVEHIHQLRESMEKLDIPNGIIYQVIENLLTEQDRKLTKSVSPYSVIARSLSPLLFSYINRGSACACRIETSFNHSTPSS